jgi:predicted glycosyltransferase
MNAEAALLGIPTISCYPLKPTCIDEYLFRMKLAERILTPDRIIARVNECLNDSTCLTRQKKRAEATMSRMEDPVRVIIRDCTSQR